MLPEQRRAACPRLSLGRRPVTELRNTSLCVRMEVIPEPRARRIRSGPICDGAGRGAVWASAVQCHVVQGSPNRAQRSAEAQVAVQPAPQVSTMAYTYVHFEAVIVIPRWAFTPMASKDEPIVWEKQKQPN